jgi:hypothetical protein
MILESLISWSGFSEDKVKYYSGSATYSNFFNLEADKLKSGRIYLDLGNVQEIASVTINGQNAGVSWIAPFVHDITNHVREGKNEVVVVVTNSWVNRLIGDSYLPKKDRFTNTNVMKFEGEDKENYLRKSGLTSEVKVIFRNKILLQ